MSLFVESSNRGEARKGQENSRIFTGKSAAHLVVTLFEVVVVVIFVSITATPTVLNPTAGASVATAIRQLGLCALLLRRRQIHAHLL